MPGVGEATAMALALTRALGGRRHEGLATLRAWARAGEHAALLQAFLLHRCRTRGALLRPGRGCKQCMAWGRLLVPGHCCICGRVVPSMQRSCCLPPAAQVPLFDHLQ